MLSTLIYGWFHVFMSYWPEGQPTEKPSSQATLGLVGRGFSPITTVPIKPIKRDTCD